MPEHTLALAAEATSLLDWGVRLAAAFPMLRAIGGLVLVLAVPGLTVTVYLDRAQRMDWPERATIALALSLVLTLDGGLILNYLPGGLTTLSWALLLIGVTLLGSLAAVRQGSMPLRLRIPRAQSWRTAVQVLLTLGALIIGVAAVFLARSSAEVPPKPGFTQLWLLPVRHAVFKVGIFNQARHTQTYLLRVAVPHAQIRTWPHVRLAPGESWVANFAVEPAELGRLEARLYLTRHPSMLFRRVWIARP